MLPWLQMSLDWTNWPINQIIQNALTLVQNCCFKPRQHDGTTIRSLSLFSEGLATSEDGLHWQRACDGQPVLSPGEGDFDALFVVSWRQIRGIFRGAYGVGCREWNHDWCENDVSKHLEYPVWWCVRGQQVNSIFQNFIGQFCKGEIQELNFFQLHKEMHKWS